MERALPEIEIEGTKHWFDIEQLALIEKDRPEKKLFFEQMKDCGTHYEFVYNLNSKRLDRERTLQGIDTFITGKHSFATVRVPRIGEIDPIGMSEKYGCTLDDVRLKSDFEIIVDQEKFQKRLNGEPVSIDIAGKIYEVDINNDALRPQDGIGKEISFEELQEKGLYATDYNSYLVIYNRVKGEIEQSDLFSKPQDYAIVEIPQQQFLDPIGFNIQNGYDPKDGLIIEELNFFHKATVVPWETYSQNFDDYLKVDASLHWGVLSPLLEEARLHSRDLPTINIQGTDFLVDVDKLELREKTNESNKLVLEDWDEEENGYGFYYDTSIKNIPYHTVYTNDTTSYVTIPEFVVMAPEEMSRKYGVPLDEITKMSDFEAMVDQTAFDMRVNKGMLPTIDIAGHTFYVDMRMDMLRPKDDFLSKGIVFDEIDHYFSEERNAYLIPYDPKKHEFQELDYDNLFSVPKDLIAVEFPFQKELDPIGWNRKGGWGLKEDLKQIGIKLNFQAKTVPWNETYINDIIRDNFDKLKNKSEKEKLQGKPSVPSQNQQSKKGRKM